MHQLPDFPGVSSQPLRGEEDDAIQIAIVGDDGVTRQRLREALQSDGDLICTVTWDRAMDGPMLRSCAPHPQVILVDIEPPGDEGITAIRLLREWSPDSRVIAISVPHHEDKVVSALKAGASGYIFKSASPCEVRQAVRATLRGQAPIGSRIIRRLVEELHRIGRKADSQVPLSGREVQVLDLVCTGITNKEIAHSLGLSVDTVRFHLKRVFERFRVRSRIEAAMKYRDFKESSVKDSERLWC